MTLFTLVCYYGYSLCYKLAVEITGVSPVQIHCAAHDSLSEPLVVDTICCRDKDDSDSGGGDPSS